jgi:hypothetical protein
MASMKRNIARIDSQLLQLVREAYELLTDADSPLDLRDWLKTARAVIEAEKRRVGA